VPLKVTVADDVAFRCWLQLEGAKKKEGPEGDSEMQEHTKEKRAVQGAA